MFNRRLIYFIITSMLGFTVQAQDTLHDRAAIEARTYELYQASDWSNLETYGNQVLAAGEDFTLLRLRVGYAQVMLRKYTYAILHYEAILKKDSYNETARYFIWFCRNMLNQSEMGNQNLPFLAPESQKKSGAHKFGLTQLGYEASFKHTDTLARGNTQYHRFFTESQMGWKLRWVNSLAVFNQQISEPKLSNITNNLQIKIHQLEYYTKLSYAINNTWQIKAAYHFMHTPFNNYLYYNNLGMLAIKHYGHDLNLQAGISGGLINDSSTFQINLQADYFPTHNTNIYGSSGLSIRNSNKKNIINFRQILGFNVNKKIWIEGAATVGKFSNISENDILYVYNAIDPNLMKLNATIYYIQNTHLQIHAGLMLEKKEIYFSDYIFNQQSINGGITWKF